MESKREGCLFQEAPLLPIFMKRPISANKPFCHLPCLHILAGQEKKAVICWRKSARMEVFYSGKQSVSSCPLLANKLQAIPCYTQQCLQVQFQTFQVMTTKLQVSKIAKAFRTEEFSKLKSLKSWEKQNTGKIISKWHMLHCSVEFFFLKRFSSPFSLSANMFATDVYCIEV